MYWIEWGFGDDLHAYHPTLPFVMDFGIHPFPKENFKFLIKQACERIASEYPAPYTLMCSGGVDSQAMIAAWLISGIPFKVVTARYNGGMNDEDISTLFEFAKRNSVDVQVIDVDIVGFHLEQLNSWADKYFCASPHVISYMYIASKITQGTVISSGSLVTKNSGLGLMSYSQFGLERYARISGQSMVPYFWIHDIDLMPMFEVINRNLQIVHPQVQPDQLLPKSRAKKNTKKYSVTYDEKYKLYQYAGLAVIPQITKFTGFEKVKEFFDSFEVPFDVKAQNLDNPSYRNYDLMFRYNHKNRGIVYSEFTELYFDVQN
jgi:hypothetical protein